MSVMIRLNSSQGKRERVRRDFGLLSRMLQSTGNSSIHFLNFILFTFVGVCSFPVHSMTREESLRYVGDGYESMMLGMLYEQMKKSQDLMDDSPDNPFAPSGAEKIFRSLRDRHLVESIAKQRPLGVSDLVVKSLKGDGGVSQRNLVK